MAVDMIERGRAAYAFETVYRYMIRADLERRKEYSSHVKKVPSMIKVNGLGQTLAFLYSKEGTDRQIYEHIDGWLQQRYGEILQAARQQQQGQHTLVEAVVRMNSDDYRIITKEVLALLEWMRRFADGLKTDLA